MIFRLGYRKPCKACDDDGTLPILTMTVILGKKHYHLTRFSSCDPNEAKEMLYEVNDERAISRLKDLVETGHIEILSEEQVAKAKSLPDEFVIVDMEKMLRPWEEIKAELVSNGVMKEERNG